MTLTAIGLHRFHLLHGVEGHLLKRSRVAERTACVLSSWLKFEIGVDLVMDNSGGVVCYDMITRRIGSNETGLCPSGV